MLSFIEAAEMFAVAAHAKQRRDDGKTPYIEHPRRVAQIVRGFNLCEDAESAAWLHDVIEDCGVSYETILKYFGESTASLVKQLTKTYPESLSRSEKDIAIANYAKGIIWPEAKLIKVADIYDNINDLRGFNTKRQVRFAEKAKIVLLNLEPIPDQGKDHIDDIYVKIKQIEET